MNKEKELKNFNTINEQLKELTELIIQRCHILHNLKNNEIETWLYCRITALTDSITTKIKKYQNNTYNTKE